MCTWSMNLSHSRALWETLSEVNGRAQFSFNFSLSCSFFCEMVLLNSCIFLPKYNSEWQTLNVKVCWSCKQNSTWGLGLLGLKEWMLWGKILAGLTMNTKKSLDSRALFSNAGKKYTSRKFSLQYNRIERFCCPHLFLGSNVLPISARNAKIYKSTFSTLRQHFSAFYSKSIGDGTFQFY